MGEFAIVTSEPVGAARSTAGVLTRMGAEAFPSRDAIAGSVDAAWRRWTLPDGRSVELWSDNFIALSIRCERDLANSIAAAAGLEIGDG